VRVRGAHRLLLSSVGLLAATVIAVAFGGVQSLATTTTTPAKTVVSLTFDDGQASQYAVLPMLRDRGMAATFYVNSGLAGSSQFYMSWQQILELANAGNEIGGHTLHHADLAQLSAETAHSEICQDRKNLIEHGGLAPITSFAYPRGAEPRTVDAVRDCGYSNARGAGTLEDWAESIPPQDPYRLRTFEGARGSTTLQDLQTRVTRAERHGGGWVVLVFHGVCDNLCTGEYSISPELFTDFLDWLEPRRSHGTVVRTVGDMIANGRTLQSDPPDTTALCNDVECSQPMPRSTRVEVSMRVAGAEDAPVATYYTTDGTDPRTSPSWQLYTRPFTVTEPATLSYYSRDAAGRNGPVETQRLLMASGGAGWSTAVAAAEAHWDRDDGLAFVALLVAVLSVCGFVVVLLRQRRRVRSMTGRQSAWRS
jgi:peptidoglycan/xylan/chitin deacetylase (PgdA/CDA1 family)